MIELYTTFESIRKQLWRMKLSIENLLINWTFPEHLCAKPDIVMIVLNKSNLLKSRLPYNINPLALFRLISKPAKVFTGWNLGQFTFNDCLDCLNIQACGSCNTATHASRELCILIPGRDTYDSYCTCCARVLERSSKRGVHNCT